MTIGERGAGARGGLRAAQVALDAAGGLAARIDAHALHTAWIGIENFDLEDARPRHQFATYRHPAEHRDNVAADGIYLLGGVADIEPGADRRHDVLKPGAADRQERAVGLANYGVLGGLIMLVLDIADDFLDDILDRRQPVGAAIFVDHQRQVNAGRLHLGEQIDRRH